MKTTYSNNPNPFIINDFHVDGFCRDNSFYIRFNDEDIDELSLYAYDMGYRLEPESYVQDPNHPLKFKIISKLNPGLFGWISKVKELVEGRWQERYLYGFYRRGVYFNKYPVTFNVQSRIMRGILKRKAEKNPKETAYFRTMYGILDLEPPVHPLDFIISWLSGCKFQYL